MAQKRMFSKDVVRTDRFLDMPLSAQALYFHLSMDADIKGFVAPGLVMRLTRAQPDDLNVLIAKTFVVPFDSGVLVVKDWHVNNQLRASREAPSQYVEEIKLLGLTEQGTYQLLDNSRSSTGVLPPRLEEIRLGETSDITNVISSDVAKAPDEEKPKNETYLYWEETITPITVAKETQRKACVNLQNKYGLEACQKMIRVVAHAHGNKYARKEVKCMTPTSLVNNWDRVLIYAKSITTQKKTNIIR